MTAKHRAVYCETCRRIGPVVQNLNAIVSVVEAAPLPQPFELYSDILRDFMREHQDHDLVVIVPRLASDAVHIHVLGDPV